jgi:hypothetical protein
MTKAPKTFRCANEQARGAARLGETSKRFPICRFAVSDIGNAVQTAKIYWLGPTRAKQREETLLSAENKHKPQLSGQNSQFPGKKKEKP